MEMVVTLLDYGAGNVRSVRNALSQLGYRVENVKTPDDILNAEKLIFPGVGSFGLVMHRLQESGYIEPLQRRIKENKPFLGICVALQALFEGSEESPGVSGLGIIPGQVVRFPEEKLSVPQIGWNGVRLQKTSKLFNGYEDEKLYFVHSYHAPFTEASRDWVLTLTDYGYEFVSAVEKGNVSACQFHPEKSGKAGLRILNNFLAADRAGTDTAIKAKEDHCTGNRTLPKESSPVLMCGAMMPVISWSPKVTSTMYAARGR